MLHHALGHGGPHAVLIPAHAYRTGHETGLQAEPVRHTDRIARIRSFKPDAGTGKPVQRRCVEPLVSRIARHARVLLVGHDEKDVRPAIFPRAFRR